MTNEHHTTPIQETVLDKIRAGAVRRRPRSRFVLRLVATVAVAGLLLVTAAFVVSFIFFSLHESGEQFLLGFGWHGVLVFLQLFPWFYAAFAIVLIIVLEWLLQGFKFGYRIPLINIFFGIIGVSLVLGSLIALTPLHMNLLQYAQEGQLPIVGASYTHILDHHDDQGVSRGIVQSVSDTSFVMVHDDHDRDHDDGTYTVYLEEGSDATLPHIGDRVLVFGQPGEDSITAEHIQILSRGE